MYKYDEYWKNKGLATHIIFVIIRLNSNYNDIRAK